MTAACLGVEDSEDNNLPDFWKKLSCCSKSKKYEAEADKPNSKYLNIDIRYCEENILNYISIASILQDFVSCCVGNLDCLDLCSR